LKQKNNMSSIIKFKIITPERVVYQDDIIEVTIPTKTGEITVFPNHTPLVTLAKTGEIKLRKENSKEIISLTIDSGVVEIRESSPANNRTTEVIILASRSELASEIDLKRAEEAYERARKLTEEKQHVSDVDFAKFEALIDKESNRIKIYNKLHR